MAFAVNGSTLSTKRVVILQPGYLPWLGFFDLLLKADIFVIFDDVQYTTRDWRSRNRVKTPHGVLWLTVPVKARGARGKMIKDVEIDNSQDWQQKHRQNLETHYKKAAWLSEIDYLISTFYEKKYKFLIDADIDFVTLVRQYFSVSTEILFSSDIPTEGIRDEKLLSICRNLSASHYLSGNAAKNYLREELFAAAGIIVEWHNYQHPYYNQLWMKEQGFISHLSVVDLLFNHGPDSLAILTGNKLIAKPDWVVTRSAGQGP